MNSLAWRLARRRWGRLLFLSSCLAIGIAFLCAGDMLLSSLGGAVSFRARDILGGDIEVSSARPFSAQAESAFSELSARGARLTAVTSFSSMLTGVREGAVPRLVSVRAVEPAYPLRGAVETEPPAAFGGLFSSDACLIDADAALQHGLRPGDSVRLGDLTLRVAGVVTRETARSMRAFQISPRVFIARSLVSRTGLERFGARIHHERLLALPAQTDPARAARSEAAALERRLADPYVSVTAYPEAEPTTRQALSRLTNYFTLTALVTLLLGAGGMAAGLAAFLDEELETAALLRALGLGTAGTAGLYRRICAAVGLQAGALGALGGWGLAAGTLKVLRSTLGLDLPLTASLDPASAAEAVVIALACAAAVSEAKIRALAAVPPLEVLRDKAERIPPSPRGTALLLAGAAAGVFLYTRYKTGSPETARWFSAAVVVSAGALALGCAAALKVLGALSRRPGLPLPARLGLNSLARRPGRSVSFIFTLSAGVALLGALDLVRHSLAAEIAAGRGAGMPDIFLVDVQRGQLEGVRGLAGTWGRGEPAFAPLVRARLQSLNGKPLSRRDELSLDQEERARQRFLLREFNLTYSDALNPSERLTAGRLWRPGEKEGQASVEESFARRTGLRLGDSLVFDIQGRPVPARITSLRRVDWLAMRPNFFVVMPEAVLRDAPQFHIGSLAVRDPAREESFRRALAEGYPNVSVIDAGVILDQVGALLKVLLAALKGLAWFCVAVGLLVLAGTVAVGHRERRSDAALLRALGAPTRLLALSDLWAFGAAGVCTFVLGAGAALSLGAALSVRLEVAYAPDPGGLTALLAASLMLPAVVGMAVSARAYSASPLETLRREE